MQNIRVSFIDLLHHKITDQDYENRFKEIMENTKHPVDRIFLRRLYELHSDRANKALENTETKILKLGK